MNLLSDNFAIKSMMPFDSYFHKCRWRPGWEQCTEVHTAEFKSLALMSRMVRMAFQYRECTVDLLKQNYTSEFMCHSHPA